MNFSYIRSHSQKLYKCLKLILLQEIRCIYKLWFRLDILKNPVNLLGYRMNVVYGKKIDVIFYRNKTTKYEAECPYYQSLNYTTYLPGKI